MYFLVSSFTTIWNNMKRRLGRRLTGYGQAELAAFAKEY
jgi:hypothetical protein